MAKDSGKGKGAGKGTGKGTGKGAGIGTGGGSAKGPSKNSSSGAGKKSGKSADKAGNKPADKTDNTSANKNKTPDKKPSPPIDNPRTVRVQGAKSRNTGTRPRAAKGVEILMEELDGTLWCAGLQNGRLQSLEVDPYAEEVRWGSVFWGKVARIDAAQDAAFVNLDGENIGILYNADVRIRQKNGVVKKGGDVAIGKLLKPGQMIAVQAKSGYLPKDPNEERAEDKNPTLTMNIVLAGRYLLYAPLEKDNRISRRIQDKAMRKQLMAMLDQMDGCTGCILRAAAAHTQTDILQREANILNLTWEQVQVHFEGDDPALIMLGPDALQRTLSDNANRAIESIEVTTLDHFGHAEEWCEIFAPDLVTKIRPVDLPDQTLDLGLFEYYDILGQIEELFQPYIILPGGASLIIQETAALTVIDVNSGADKRGHLTVNLDAADEVARQLRLRNQGGLIVVDFLRLKGKAETERFLDRLRAVLNDDPCTVQLYGLTKGGLMELTRQRRTPPLIERFKSAMALD